MYVFGYKIYQPIKSKCVNSFNFGVYVSLRYFLSRKYRERFAEIFNTDFPNSLRNQVVNRSVCFRETTLKLSAEIFDDLEEEL